MDRTQAKDKAVGRHKAQRAKNQAGSYEQRLNLPEFSQSLPMVLMRSRETVMRYFRPPMRERGITEQQWRVLRTLSCSGAIEVTELARITLLLAPSLSRILRDLDKRGLIERRSVKTDLRRNVVSISQTGRRLIRVVGPKVAEAYAEIRNRFGDKRLSALQRLLRELEAALLAGLPNENGAGNGAPKPSARRRKIS
jgi:homoprotocatechuate degradation regulator HpaR